MSARAASASTASSRIVKSNSDKPLAQWVRPADWLTLPTVLDTDQKFVGLHMVHPDANFLALTAAGNYTVDWGDGLVEDFASGVVAQHEYNYATYDVANATLCSRGYKQAIVVVTPQAGQTLTLLDLHRKHSSITGAYSSGFVDIVVSGPSIAELMISVQDPGNTTQVITFANLEQVSVLSSDVRNCELMFLYCRNLRSVKAFATSTALAVTITATNVGNTFTSVGHNRRVGDTLDLLSRGAITAGISVGVRYYVKSVAADTFQIASTSDVAASAITPTGTGTVVFAGGTSLYATFNACSALASLPVFNTKSVVNMSGMFAGCSALVSVPLFNTASVVNMTSMFSTCSALISVPLFNTSSAVNMFQMFYACSALTSVPLLDTSAATTTASMFFGCSSLTSVPLFNTSAVTLMSDMFSGCTSLQSVPLFNTSAVKNMNYMFNGCRSLSSVPLFDTAAVTGMANMFYACHSLKSVPLFNTSSVTQMDSMFRQCSSLASIPLLNTAAVTSMASTFHDCISLTSVPALDVSSVLTTTTMFNVASSLSSVGMTGMQVTFSVLNCKLSAARLNELYTNLVTVGSGSVTFQVAADTVTKAAHGLIAGMYVSFSVVTGTTGITASTGYYVVNPTIDTFQLSLTKGGAAINLTGVDGTGTFSTRTITVTGNYGTASDNPAIATAKGWTVTG